MFKLEMRIFRMIKTKRKEIKREAVKEMFAILYAYVDEDVAKQLHGEFNSIIEQAEYKTDIEPKDSFKKRVERKDKVELGWMLGPLKYKRDKHEFSKDNPKRLKLFQKYDNQIKFIENHIAKLEKVQSKLRKEFGLEGNKENNLE